MKKLLGILLIVIFTFSLYFSTSNDVDIKSGDSHGYATIIPIPTPESPEKIGL